MTVDPDSGLLSPVRAGTPAETSTGDEAWLRAMLDAEAALARAQARLGTVPSAAADAITEAAGNARIDVVELARGSRATANPVVGLVKALTSAVGAIAPDAAEYVHRGSTSQDIFDTAMMLVADRTLRPLADDLDATAEALADLARAHRDTVMAGRTLTAHAVPTTFGLKAAGWRRLVLDAAARVRRVLDGGLPVSLGGAAGTLAAYVEYARLADAERADGGLDNGGHAAGVPADAGPAGAGTAGAVPAAGVPADAGLADASVAGGGAAGTKPAGVSAVDGGYAERLTAAFAEETGLAAPVLPWHSLRTPVVDLAGALAFTAGALGKLAVDVETLTRTELGEVAEPAASGRGGSSAMPHKRNPVLATLIRSAALQVPVLAAGVTQSMLAEDERSAGVWHAEWQLVRECLRLTGGAAYTAVELARGLTVLPERMRDNLASTHGLIVSERLSAVLSPLLGKAAAKELLGEASQRAVREDRPLREVLDELPAITGVLTPAALDGLLDPAGYTGAAATLVDRALGDGEPAGDAADAGGKAAATTADKAAGSDA
ncbi:adenylosuccinate lyase family protein [Amycolatopsis sp. NBC_01307]|uniref:class-II fumarase/aspartase family protein n=1 Tax=Amycolatopsis sp. NBC_01307 TaxID=2903561 RepID=UPI002E104A32|nr:adenylosuccinate lyase family protein [Amycolatopsis sp. NBC_01307]